MLCLTLDKLSQNPWGCDQALVVYKASEMIVVCSQVEIPPAHAYMFNYLNI